MEEILRYVLLHSARRRDPALTLPLAAEATSLGQRLMTLRQGDDPRADMLAAVAAFLDSADFAADLRTLPFHAELAQFRRQAAGGEPLTLGGWQSLVQAAFGRSARALMADPEVSRLRVRVVEAVLALKLATGARSRLLAPYLDLARLIDLLGRIANRDPSLADLPPRTLLGRTVRLPPSIFPLPRKAEAVTREDRAREAERARSLSSLAARLGDVRAVEIEMRAAGPGGPARLSARSRDLLASLDLDPAAAPRDTALARLGAESRALSAEVAILGQPSLLPGPLAVGDIAVPDAPRVPTSVGLARPSGVGSLLMVLQQIKRYEAGELAHVENVLQSESRNRETRRLRRTEETLVTEIEKKAEEERDLQSTDRHEMKKEAEETIKEDERFKIGATVSAGYGKIFQTEVSTEFETSNSQETKDRSATTFAREVTEKAASKVSERIRTEHTIRTIEEFEEKNSHGFDNTEGAGHVIGIYQWLDRVYEAQVYDYGMRLFFDVLVPEPAAFLLQAQEHTKTSADLPPRPAKFDLRPDQIDDHEDGPGTYYQELVRRYQVSGVAPPPAETRTFSWSIMLPAEGEAVATEPPSLFMKAFSSIQIPDGYRTETARFAISRQIFFGEDHFLQLHLGGATLVTVHFDDDPAAPQAGAVEIPAQSISGNTGTFAIGLYSVNVVRFVLVVEIACTRTEQHFQAWQASVHAAVLTAYLALEAAHRDAKAAQSVQQGVAIEGRNPGENRMLERTELKRLAISTITGQYFDKFSAILESATREARIDFDEAAAEGNYARFFEQAFEWENMTWELYPYYWARRSTWVDRLLKHDVDPLHAEFLKAGYARLRIPVRPDFELGVFHYLETGEAWDGGELPDLVSEDYLALMEELKERRADFMTRIAVGRPWEIRLPTTLVRLKPTPALPAWQRDEDGTWLPVPEEPVGPPGPDDPEEPENPADP